MSAQADLLIHPVRLRVLQALAGRQLTTTELRDHLADVPQASLYRHVDRLLDGGVLEVVDERPVRGAVERTLALVEGAASLGGDQLADATRQQHLTWFATFLAGLLGQLDRYLDTGAPADAPVAHDLEADAVSYRQVPLWLDDDEAHALLADLREVVRSRLEHEPRPGRRRRLLGLVVLPDADEPTA